MAQITEADGNSVVDSFDDFDLHEDLLHGIYSNGFERPSEIQQRAIRPILDGRNTVCRAPAGSGKTAASLVGALQKIDYGQRDCQALILAPTRELAQQIQKAVLALGEYLHIKCHALIGGTSIRNDMEQLKSGQHCVVGTPGRVMHMIRHRHLQVDNLLVFVVDDADVMLSRGLEDHEKADQIVEIFGTLPSNVQVCLNATTESSFGDLCDMAAEISDRTTKFMRNAVQILVETDELSLDGIRQFYIAMQEGDKLHALFDLYETLTITQAVIYCNSRRSVDYLADQMTRRGFVVSAFRTDLDQRERELMMREFRSGSSRVLVTTHSLARGIDAQQVSLVINYDLPSNIENYLHCVGRSGRFDHSGRVGHGVAINFVTESDVHMMKEIEQFHHTQIEEMKLRTCPLSSMT